MAILDSIKDPVTGKIKPVWLIAGAGIGGVGLLMLMGRGSSGTQTSAGQSSDITGSLGDLQAALQALLANRPGGGTTTGGPVTIPTTTTTHSNIPASTGSLPRTNMTSYISTVAAPHNTAPAATTVKTGGLTPTIQAAAATKAVQTAATAQQVSSIAKIAQTVATVAKTTAARANVQKLPATQRTQAISSWTLATPKTVTTVAKPATTAAKPATIASGTARSVNPARDNPY